MSDEFTGTWITVSERTPSLSGKTSLWTVRSRMHPELRLGTIRWNPGWRMYVFHPVPDSFFEETCMREVADFCQTQTVQHKGGVEQ